METVMRASEFVRYILTNPDFESNYEKGIFWSTHLSKEHVSKIFSWTELNNCLSRNRITRDRLRLSTKLEHDLVNKRAFRSVRDSLGRNTDYLVVSELHQLMQEGVTAVLEAVNELSPTIEELTQGLGCELGARSTANAYMSFGDMSGFGVHNDDHDVLIVQIDGEKKWRFFKSEFGTEKATVNELRQPSDSDLGEELIVTAGDILFIPKGTWHDVVAINEKSLHLTISLVYPTVVDFINWGLLRDKFGIPYADIRPSKNNHANLREKCREYFDNLITEENVEKFLHTHYAAHAASRVRVNFPDLNAPVLENGFRRIPYDVVAIDSETYEPSVRAFALGRVHTLLPEEFGLLCRLPHTRSMSGEEILFATGQAWSSVSTTLQGLMERGLVGTVAQGKVGHTNGGASD
jgi:hypothetical protein